MITAVIRLKHWRANIEHRIQFSLRILLIALVGCSIAIVFRLELLELLDRWFMLSTILAFICGLLICRHVRFPRSNVWWIAFVLLAVVCVYACFARHRIDAPVIDAGFPRGFPYPDNMIIRSAQYWAQPLEGVPPGSIDFHGGMIETLAIAQWSAIISALLTGLSAGAAIRSKNAG